MTPRPHSLLFVPLFALLFLTACAAPCVEIQHSPVIARSNESVTFTATNCGVTSNINILVNAAQVKSCANVANGATCSFTGGPYPAYQGTTVSYAANATDSQNHTVVSGYFYFGITDTNYNWAHDWIPARYVGATSSHIDLVFHPTSEYTSLGTFVTDVGDKIWNRYHAQDVIRFPGNFNLFNFYVYKNAATVTNCGTVHTDADTDMPWRNVDAVLHVADFQDCSSVALQHFTAEGSTNTKAFLHESGHAVLGLSDEYDGCYTAYFQPADEPNIWSSSAACQSEQTAKSRSTSACWKFTNCSGGWWGIQGASDNTIMQQGMTGDPWGTEGRERAVWAFAHPTVSGGAGIGVESQAVAIVSVIYRSGQWLVGPEGVRLLPCPAPVPTLAGDQSKPVARLLDADGKLLYERYLPADPRLIMCESGDGRCQADTDPATPGLLKEVAFNLRLPYVKGMRTLEFVVPPLGKEEKPAVLKVDLSDAIRKYESSAPDKSADCQEPEFKPDALKK